MHRRRNIGSFFLLMLSAAPLLFLSFLQLKQAYIKHTLEERLETGLLKTIFIPQQDLKRINSRELLVNGKLFDVKAMHPVKNGFMVTGVFDEEETAVLKQLDNTWRQRTSKETSLLAQVFQLLQAFFFQAADDAPLLAQCGKPLFQKPIPLLPVLNKPVLSPPPQRPA